MAPLRNPNEQSLTRYAVMVFRSLGEGGGDEGGKDGGGDDGNAAAERARRDCRLRSSGWLSNFAMSHTALLPQQSDER